MSSMKNPKRGKEATILGILEWDTKGDRAKCEYSDGDCKYSKWFLLEEIQDELVIYSYWIKQNKENWPDSIKRLVIRMENENELGCSPKLRHLGNQENWRSVYKALSFVRKFEHFESYSDSLECQRFEGEVDELKDMIYLRPLANYLYVYVSLANQNLSLVIDGENHYLESHEDSPIRRLVEFELGFPRKTVKAIRFIGQKEVDHCVSSAALIVLACKEIYKNNAKNWPESIKADPFKWSDSIEFMNYQKGVSMPTLSKANNNMPGCPKCGDRRPKWREANLKTHIESCDGNTKRRKRS